MSTLGPRTALKDRKISGSLAYILSQTNVKQGTKAAPNDVAGCTLEMGADGLWTGASVGTLTQVQADALVASGVLATVKTATPATVNGQSVQWGGAGVGWVPKSILGRSFGSRMLIIGDSISNYYGGSGVLASILSNGAYRVAANAAIPGMTLEGMLAYLQTAVTSANMIPGDMVRIQGGTNNAMDNGGGTSSITGIRSLISQLINKSRSMGLIPILSLIPPHLTYKSRIEAVNFEIANSSAKYGAPLLEPWRSLRAANGGYVSGKSIDLVHPAETSLHQCAIDESMQMLKLLGTGVCGFAPWADTNGGGLATNPLLQGAPVSGVAPGASIYGTAVASVSEGAQPWQGNFQNATISNQTNLTGVYAAHENSAGSPPAGHRILAVAEIHVSQGIRFNVWGRHFSSEAMFGPMGGGITAAQDISGIAMKEFIASGNAMSGMAVLTDSMGANMSGSIGAGRFQVYDMTSLNL